MTPIKTYTVPKYFWLVPLAATLFLLGSFRQPYGWGVKLFVALFLLFIWYNFLVMPVEIRLLADQSVLFKGVLKESRVKVADIMTLEKSAKATTLIHTGGKVWLSMLISEVDDFFDEIKTINPAITEDYEPVTKFVQTPRNFILLVLGVFLAGLVLTAAMLWLA